MKKPIVPETSAQRAGATRSQHLATHYLDWCRRPASRHVACLLLLALLPLLRWPAALTSQEPLGDEPAYRAAFAQVAAGASPYVGTDYVYPAVFAFAGAWSAAHLGLEATMYLLRAANLAGLPAITGLYTTVVCLVAYAAFGPSPYLVLGPDSSLGPIIAADMSDYDTVIGLEVHVQLATATKMFTSATCASSASSTAP